MSVGTAIFWLAAVAAGASLAWWLSARRSRARVARVIRRVSDRVRRGIASGPESLHDPALPELDVLREALSEGYVPRGAERLETAATVVARVSDYLEALAAKPLRAALRGAPPGAVAAMQEALDIFQAIRTHRVGDPLVFEPHNLTQLVQEVVDEFTRDSRSTVKLVAPEAPVRSPVAKDAFQDAVYLILLNGEQFSGGKPLEVRLLAEERVARVLVRDRGPGFSGEALERGADPFYTTQAAALGLGLTHALQVVVAHRGELYLRNRESGGGEVEIVIPTSRV
ncbi:MAG: HAMP domain-containing histidine kinase [Gemmatimonadetes bacterium]|nr:HAMP domain-containing histidine kinase [Gemmatimonadota bacterium]